MQPWAATYVNNRQIVPAQILQIPLPFVDVVAIRINPGPGQRQIIVANVYNPCDKSLIEDLSEEMIAMNDGIGKDCHTDDKVEESDNVGIRWYLDQMMQESNDAVDQVTL
jgi:hypothetical protein